MKTKTWFDSEHCSCGRHCKTCRNRNNIGLIFRRSLIKVFTDLKVEDYECPHGKTWSERIEYKEVTFIIKKENKYDLTVKAINDSKDEGLWHDLKEELRMLNNFLELNSHQSGCWKNKQKQRLIKMLEVVKKKEGIRGVVGERIIVTKENLLL